MGQLFKPKDTRFFRFSIIFAVIAAIAILVAIDLSPRRDQVTRLNIYVKQEVPFSHEHHAGEMGIDCRFCHTQTSKSPFAGIPETQTCMKCHSLLFKEAPMLEPVRKSFRTGKPLVWKRVYNLPDYVYFDHSIHVSKGVDCTECHGQLKKMPLVRKQKAFFMRECLACHRNVSRYVADYDQTQEVVTKCSTCHR